MNATSSSVIEIDYYKELQSFTETFEIPTVKCRMLNFFPATKIKNLKANMFEKFVSVTGTVVRISNSKPFLKRLAFECKKCAVTFVRIFIKF